MATYIKGDAIANATSYELLEKASDGTYTSLSTNTEINFEVSALGLAAGNHTLVVKAKADGYEDSDYSNEVVYTVEDSGEVDLTEAFTSNFAQGGIYADSTHSNYAGAHTALTNYRGNTANTAYISVADYSEQISNGAKLQITMPYAMTEALMKYGLVFYSDTGKSNALEGVTLEYTDGSVAAAVKELDIPEGTKYIRTTWHTAENEAACGVAFSAKLLY